MIRYKEAMKLAQDVKANLEKESESLRAKAQVENLTMASEEIQKAMALERQAAALDTLFTICYSARSLADHFRERD